MIGLVGLGAMGGGYLSRLMEQNCDVLCYDAMPEARARAEAAGAEVAASLADFSACDTVILSLPKAAIVASVMEELGPHLQQGAIVVDTSTSEPDTTKRLATQAQDDGYTFLDGPVSGGPLGARSGTMTMVVGGDADAFAKARPLLEKMTGKLVHIGPSGAGHTVKIANNLLCAANLVLMSEMAQMAERAGISLSELLTGINAGSGRSGVSEVNFPKWITNEAYDSGFTMGLMRKDVGLATGLADRLGIGLPATETIASIWENSREMLDDSADFNEIYKYRKRSNA
ncbi:2-(hydroxymethyl)glutarate dehydrogenase [Thalassovita autumnalis]|uniref:2-(Hydroxymethyl)glutarate dehydrogenase n=1 Tax=Thalassovita autumnalis TaxID=2072972 RepID=A0A0P1FA43_9RHOB|nr:NAD(P)-dependent oxidoreductase [Thalassovita autumnalis]CUH64680.1 2-(hydroxymethyl)glutarate dehydrogenase [Thalassovita autumnalis]CUH70258.1 2-(hydroxymethyl)glutarate dehydrogenase [Thalassovita autumnalis]